MSNSTKTIIIREFPVELHAEFKSLCALVPVAMNRKIIEMVTAFVGEHREMIQADHVTIDDGTGCVQAVGIDSLPVGASRAIKKVKERRIIKSTAKGEKF